MGLVPGIAAVNAVLLGVGYSLLAPALRAVALRVWLSYAGLALLTGVAATGVALTVTAVLGIGSGVVTFLCAAAVLAAAGVAASRRWPIAALPAPRAAGGGRAADAVATASAFGVAAVCAFGIVGGFRSSAWLDDVWQFWLPRGLALDELGLDPTLFAPSTTIESFANPYYPLLWSMLTALDVRFVGEIDLRAPNAQLALLVVAFVAAVARLLWGRVRPVFLWPGLLLLVASPALFRQAQAGGADLPLAFFLVLAVLGAAGWLLERQPFALVVLAVGAAGAAAMKREGIPQLLLFLAVVSVPALWGRRRALIALWTTAAAGIATLLPWLAWQWRHGALDDPITQAAASGSTSGIARVAIESLLRWSTRPQEWLFVLPLFVVLAVAVVVRERRAVWLTPPALLVAGYLFWVWFFVTDPYNTVASFPIAYRVVDALLVLAAVSIPVLAERVVRR